MAKRRRRGKRRKDQNRNRGLLIVLGVGFAVVAMAVVLVGLAKDLIPLLIIGGGLVFLGLFLMALPFLPSGLPGDLIVGKKAIIWEKGGEEIGQIPFDNIGSVGLEWYLDEDSGANVTGVGIYLLRRKDPNTWWPEKHKDLQCDILIPDIFNRPVVSLATTIAARVDELREDRYR